MPNGQPTMPMGYDWYLKIIGAKGGTTALTPDAYVRADPVKVWMDLLGLRPGFLGRRIEESGRETRRARWLQR